MTQRRSVLVREDRLVQRVEQRHEALGAVGQRPGRYRQPPFGHPRRDAVERAEAGVALEQSSASRSIGSGRSSVVTGNYALPYLSFKNSVMMPSHSRSSSSG